MNKQAQQGLADLSKHNTLDTKRSPRQEIIEQLINLYNQGQLVAVFKKAKALTEQYPEAVLIWNILGPLPHKWDSRSKRLPRSRTS